MHPATLLFMWADRGTKEYEWPWMEGGKGRFLFKYVYIFHILQRVWV